MYRISSGGSGGKLFGSGFFLLFMLMVVIPTFLAALYEFIDAIWPYVIGAVVLLLIVRFLWDRLK